MLQHTRHIIFATNFSDACHAAIPAVARWVDLLQCKLSLLHVYDADRILYRDANALLQSFFAEADNYPQCQRVSMSGDPAEGISEFCQRHRDALLVLPPSDQTGLPRPWHRSLRARMIQAPDHAALAQAVVARIDDTAALQGMQTAAFEQARTLFRWSDRGEALLSALFEHREQAHQPAIAGA